MNVSVFRTRIRYGNTYFIILAAPFSHHSNHAATFLCSKKKGAVHLHYEINAIFPASAFIVCLPFTFIWPSFPKDRLQPSAGPCVGEVRRVCIKVCVRSRPLQSGGRTQSGRQSRRLLQQNGRRGRVFALLKTRKSDWVTNNLPV